MGGEFARGEADDLGGRNEGAVDHALARAREPEPAMLPSFRQLPRHRRADIGRDAVAAIPSADPALEPNPKPPPRTPRRVPPSPLPQPMQSPEWRAAPPWPHPLPLIHALPSLAPARRWRWRRLRATALLLAGSAIGATAATLLVMSPPVMPIERVESTSLAVLPALAAAPPPPQIIYLDRWQIVSPEPPPPQTYQMLAPALPATPPPQIVFIERAAAPSTALAAKPKPHQVRAKPSETKPQPEPQPPQRDVAKEIELWFSRSPGGR